MEKEDRSSGPGPRAWEARRRDDAQRWPRAAAAEMTANTGAVQRWGLGDRLPAVTATGEL